MKSLFIHATRDLNAAIAGGVQKCSAEFLQVVQAASDVTSVYCVDECRNMIRRVLRKCHAGSYLGYDPGKYIGDLARLISTNDISHVFLNKAELVRFAPAIRRLSEDTQIIILSHGNQSGDDLYEIAGPSGRLSGVRRLFATWQIGLDLRTESAIRHRDVDAVCVMSEEEGIIERWLGAKRVFCIPRLIDCRFIEWEPIPGQMGFVGTLDHTPNRVALEQLLPLLETTMPPQSLELVGGPIEVGLAFERQFRCVRYLGRLHDSELISAATRWALFINPIFWLSRGASMKLGQALSWGLPVVTTESGMRGYTLPHESVVITSDCHMAFSRKVIELSQDINTCRRLRDALLENENKFVTVREVGDQLRAWASTK